MSHSLITKGLIAVFIFLALQGCHHTKDPDGGVIQLQEFVNEEDLRDAAYVVVVKKDGTKKLVSAPNSNAKVCSKNRATKQEPTCKLFSEKRKILDTTDTISITSQGSPICITEKIGNNTYIETCYE